MDEVLYRCENQECRWFDTLRRIRRVPVGVGLYVDERPQCECGYQPLRHRVVEDSPVLDVAVGTASAEGWRSFGVSIRGDEIAGANSSQGSVGPESKPVNSDADRLFLDLKGAYERLCRAQRGLPGDTGGPLAMAAMQIARFGREHCPSPLWSRFDV